MAGAVFVLLMLGVTRLPEKYRNAFLQFTDAFRESQNYASFKALASALIITKGAWTVTALDERISRPDEKSRRAYSYFFTNATWNATDLADALLSYICARLAIDHGDEILIHIDDSFSRKFGDVTDGVADFRNPTTGQIEDGNVLVTSCLQARELYVPFRVVPYLGEEEATTLGEPFRMLY